MAKSIYVPGIGQVTPGAMRVHKRVNEYDERLSFCKNPVAGDYVVKMSMPHGEPDRIIHGFGYDIPPADYVLEQIIKKDTLRQGQAWFDKTIAEHNAKLKAAKEYARDQQVWDAAERVEHSLRKTEGLAANPNVKSVRNLSKKK